MAVALMKNRNPEPDDPSDYHIVSALMKCADGNLYIAGFWTHLLDQITSDNHWDKNPRKLPGQDAFGEGDIITVMQTYSIYYNAHFFAYYEHK